MKTVKHTYYVNKHSAKLLEGGYVPISEYANNMWFPLPSDYQSKVFEDIRAVVMGNKIIVAHHELKPAMLFDDHWSKIEAVKDGTMVREKNGIVSFEEPRPTPTEQREAFQKQYPHLVKVRPGFKFVASADTSPKHYRQGKIEPWDFIISQKMGFLEGNIVKYITRYKAKNGLEDLLKAKTYLERLIKEVSCEKSKD